MLVVLRGGSANAYQDARPAARVEMELFERYRLPFAFVTCREEEFGDTSRAFMRNVQADGIALFDSNAL